MTNVELAAVVAAALGGMLVPQIGLTGWFAWMVPRRMRAHGVDAGDHGAAGAVPAEVVLCLRGCDATLEDVFAALARQRHPDWRLRVIVDSEQDPAWNVAHAAVHRLEEREASWREATIQPLTVRPTEGSLKCASLRQAFASLDSRTQVVALLDADSVVRDDWLATMVSQTMQRGVGAVSGNRWYEPAHDSVPGTVRVIWNVGAIAQMSAFGIPWGGSLAVRREAMETSGWLDIIRTTLCEDTALPEPLACAGWKYRFVPSLIAVDVGDDVAIGPLTRWIARQLLTARLHHPSWPLVAVHGLGTSLALVAGLAWAVTSAACAAWGNMAVALAALACYEVVTSVLFLVITWTVRNNLAAAGARLRPYALRRMLWQVALIPLTQVVYGIATVVALSTRSVEWRGIVYDVARINGRLGVRARMAGDQEPARDAEAPTG